MTRVSCSGRLATTMLLALVLLPASLAGAQDPPPVSLQPADAQPTDATGPEAPVVIFNRTITVFRDNGKLKILVRFQ